MSLENEVVAWGSEIHIFEKQEIGRHGEYARHEECHQQSAA